MTNSFYSFTTMDDGNGTTARDMIPTHSVKLCMGLRWMDGWGFNDLLMGQHGVQAPRNDIDELNEQRKTGMQQRPDPYPNTIFSL